MQLALLRLGHNQGPLAPDRGLMSKHVASKRLILRMNGPVDSVLKTFAKLQIRHKLFLQNFFAMRTDILRFTSVLLIILREDSDVSF